MNHDSNQWPSFNVKTLSPLSRDEVSEVESACSAFNGRFNNAVAEEYRYLWNASPLNLENLDYDFYEFGGDHWYWDNGYGFTCAWGQILVTSFGFQWMRMEGAETLRDWVLKHEEAFYVFFPWQTLWGIVESVGYQFEKAAGCWMRILNNVDAVYPLPTGWHPIPDALNGDVDWVPEEVVDAMRPLYNHPDWCYETLGLHPYEWDRNSDWEQVRQYLNSKRVELDSAR